MMIERALESLDDVDDAAEDVAEEITDTDVMEAGVDTDEARGPLTGLARYLRQAARVPYPTAAQERALAAIIQDTTRSRIERERAVGELCAGHLRWVVALARRFRLGGVGAKHLSLSIEDFVAAGNVGLTIAAWKFDGSHRFSTYATAWIWREMQRECAEVGDATQFPWHLWPDVQRVRRVWTLRDHWSIAELAAETGVTPERVTLIYPWLAGTITLGMAIVQGAEETSRWEDVLAAAPESDPQVALEREGSGLDARMVLRYLLDPSHDAPDKRQGNRWVPASRDLTWRERRVLAVRYRLRLPLSWLLPDAEERTRMLAADYERVYWETLKWLGQVVTERERGTYADGDPRPPLNLDEAARFVGVSRERVRQIELHALTKLKERAEQLGITAREVL